MHALRPDGHHRQPTTTPSLTQFYTCSFELLRTRGVTVLADSVSHIPTSSTTTPVT